MKVTAVKRTLALFLLAAMLFVPACGKKAEENTETPALSELDLNEYMEVGDYKNLTIETTKRVVVTDDAVQQQVLLARSNFAASREKTTAAAISDQVNMDYVGTVDGVAFAGGTAQDFDVTLGSGQLIKGFEEGLVGHKAGDKVTLNLTFPTDYTPDLAGKNAVFTVTINHVYELTMPDYTDAFVKEHYGFGTTKAFEEEIRYNLQNRYDSAYRANLEDKLIAALMEVTTFKKLPQEEYDKRYTEYVGYYTQIAEQQYGQELRTYVGTTLNMSIKEFYDNIAMEISRYLQQRMLVTYIAQKENLTISDEEYAMGALKFAQSQGIDSVADLEMYYEPDEIRMNLLFEKVVDKLLETATVKEK